VTCLPAFYGKPPAGASARKGAFALQSTAGNAIML